ncbi:DUF3644 domain-containing protein [Microvirga sp. 2TAF3]|uniref:DUF3644 domain-containing protein n=1 Tax=Microvirga sp. 2TAF3 TaxID=3233014 RepID=UPI003F9D7B76
MSLAQLNDWEVRLIKAFCEHTDLNDQQILAYFTRPSRTINHRVIGGLRLNKYFPKAEAASEEELAHFRDNWFRYSVAKGDEKRIEELINKSREGMLAAIQTFNNPQVHFRSEIFIVLCVIAWTYALHAFLTQESIDIVYRGKDKKPVLTPGGQPKYWELSKCLSHPLCSLDAAERANLFYLLDIRHEIEHRCTGSIDAKVASRLQAAALNFNTYLTTHFGGQYRIDTDFGVAIQMSSFSHDQAKQLYSAVGLERKIEAVIDDLDKQVGEEIRANTKFAFKVIFVEQACNHPGQADQVVSFVRAGTHEAEEIQRVLLREIERPKYKPSQIVIAMQKKGFKEFNIPQHTLLWRKHDAKNPKKGFGVMLADKQWYYYKEWLKIVEDELIAQALN